MIPAEENTHFEWTFTAFPRLDRRLGLSARKHRSVLKLNYTVDANSWKYRNDRELFLTSVSFVTIKDPGIPFLHTH